MTQDQKEKKITPITKKRVLLTNDDGISSPGLRDLYLALKDDFDVVVVAPMSEQSGKSTSITYAHPVSYQKQIWDETTTAWSVEGTPADCIKTATHFLFDSPPDMVISGVNHGSNLGRSILYSGTFGGAVEGAFKNIPSIAMSLIHDCKKSYYNVNSYILKIVKHFFSHPIPKGSLINVNIPHLSEDEIEGVRFARQGMSFWEETPHYTQDDKIMLGGIWKEHEEHKESDVSLIKEGFITVVPIYVNELTHNDHFHSHKEVFNDTFKK